MTFYCKGQMGHCVLMHYISAGLIIFSPLSIISFLVLTPELHLRLDAGSSCIFPKCITGMSRLLEFPWLSELLCSLGGKIISTSLSPEEQDGDHFSTAAQEVGLGGFLMARGAIGFGWWP